GKYVALAITIQVHKLWSRARASPHTRYFRDRTLGFKPLARRKLGVAKVSIDADLALVKLTNKKVFLAITVEISPAGCSVSRTFNSHGGISPDKANRRFEFGGATCGKRAAQEQCLQ